jgi:hypothetical protein
VFHLFTVAHTSSLRVRFKAIVAASVLALAACGSTSTTDVLPTVTSISVRADAITAGRGCGSAAGQVFKYVVLVMSPDMAYVVGNVYDCFADATFVDLPDVGVRSYTMSVFAFDRAAYLAAGEGALNAKVNGWNANVASATPAALAALRSTATYETTCTAPRLDQVQRVASCQP